MAADHCLRAHRVATGGSLPADQPLQVVNQVVSRGWRTITGAHAVRAPDRTAIGFHINATAVPVAVMPG